MLLAIAKIPLNRYPIGMNTIKAAIAALVILAPSLVLAEENPLAPTESGKILCSEPDFQNRTCRGITKYSRTGENNYIAEETFILPLPGTYQITITSSVQTRGKMHCTVIDVSKIRTAVFQKNGKPVEEWEQKVLVQSLTDLTKSIGVKEICAKYEPAQTCGQDLLRAFTLFDSKEKQGGSKYVAWVRPEEGYKIREDRSFGPEPSDGCQS